MSMSSVFMTKILISSGSRRVEARHYCQEGQLGVQVHEFVLDTIS
jgi:hypothetical protein